MKAKILSFSLLASLLFAASAMASSDKWIHVKVESANEETVTVNLPLSLVNAAAAMMPAEMQAEINDEMEVAFDDLKLSWGDLRTFWEEVRNTPEATFVTVQSKDETVVVKKEGRYMLVETAESSANGAQVNVRFPLAVVDALLSGPENTLNFQAALAVLAEEDHGHLVSVNDGDDHIRVWIDNQNVTE